MTGPQADDAIGRRRFLGYVLAAPTLVTAAGLDLTPPASSPRAATGVDLLDLNDLMTAAALPTSGLIAEELSVPVERVRVTLADARPELLFNQLTGGSNTTFATYTPIRVAAAVARLRLMAAAAAELGAPVTDLTLRAGTITDRSGRRVGIG
ncbi:molybdopterin cofactor-binding domain-containing protein, partial [Nonomuraea fuscirosea]